MKAELTYHRRGFSLVEVMIASGLLGIIGAGIFSVHLISHRIWHSTSLNIQTANEANMAINRIVYGPGPYSGLRSAISVSVSGGSSSDGTSPWEVNFSNEDGSGEIIYNPSAKNIIFEFKGDSILICTNVVSAEADLESDGNAVSVSLTVERHDGRFSAASKAEAFIMLRNK